MHQIGTAALRITLFAMLSVAPLDALAVELDADSESIMELILSDGTLMTDALIIYPSGNDWYFPLRQTGESLGLAIEVSSSLSAANGFILQENRSFNLDIPNCKVTYGNVSEKFDCRRVTQYEDDIYVSEILMD